MGSLIVTGILGFLLFVIMAVSFYGMAASGKSSATIAPPALIPGEKNDTLFVLVHGLHGNAKSWDSVRPALHPYGDVAAFYYDAGVTSNVEPADVAAEIADGIDSLTKDGKYEHVVLIGNSVGALIARRAYLIAAKKDSAWTRQSLRIVLLAGMNRGWDITGKKPLDMSRGRQVVIWLSAWFGRLANVGNFSLRTETGAPFVSNLRLDWLQWFRDHPDRAPVTVQLLGDIDDVVSDEDNKDLRGAPGARFYWLRVRGTAHGNIADFADLSGKSDTYPGIGPYRREKFLLAATKSVEEIEKENEEQGFQTDPRVTHLVFVLHGIRDLGEWSADFERELRALPQSKDQGLRIVSVRYGYFSMASFLFRPDRQKFVRWFMDQYTETLSRYPNARTIDFVGHSNGTYLLASALTQYSSMQIRRIVFAGSVVRKNYDWTKIHKNGQVKALRNYIATEDAVVALFPRFFEPKIMRWAGNDVGSAGFNGFEDLPNENFSNVTISGGHSAFRKHVPEIVGFVVSTDVTSPSQANAGSRSILGSALKLHSNYAFFLIWILLLALIAIPGIRVAVAGGEYGLIPLVLYVALVASLLMRL